MVLPHQLLARHAAAPGSLPAPKLHARVAKARPNVRAPPRTAPSHQLDEDLSDLGSDPGLDADSNNSGSDLDIV